MQSKGDYINEYGNFAYLYGYVKGADVNNPVGDERLLINEPFERITFTRNADGSLNVTNEEY